MFEVRIHGRGGQGVVSSAELLSVAAFREGRYAQAFPSFGSERMGGPVTAFCRIDDKEIRLREPVMEPDGVLVFDPSLLRAGALDGVRASTCVTIDSTRVQDALGEDVPALPRACLCAVPATAIALEHLGRPLPNAAMLGAFAALTGCVRFESLIAALRARFAPRFAEANVAAAAQGFAVAARRLEVAHA